MSETEFEKLEENNEMTTDADITEMSSNDENVDNVEKTESAESDKKVEKVSMKTYQSMADRAAENKSSAYSLIGVGVVGLIFMVLGFTGVIGFRIGNRFIFYGVMGAVFIIFIICGFVSMANAKTYSAVAEAEGTLKKELDKWVEDNLTKEFIDSNIPDAGNSPEEELYFDRTRIIRILIMRDFVNIDLEFLEHYIDEVVYDKLFD